MVNGADNAIGVLESNIPIDEIVSNPNGNMLFEKILSRKNATKARNRFYNLIDEEIAPLKNHSSFFGKPDFSLGTIIQTENGKFKYTKDVSEKTEKIMSQERKIEDPKTNDKTIQINPGNGIPILNQDCWMEQTKGIDYVGIGENATYYKYSPEVSTETDDEKFVYVGKLKIGETNRTINSEGKREE